MPIRKPNRARALDVGGQIDIPQVPPGRAWKVPETCLPAMNPSTVVAV
jgi:hypothetical protein